MKTKTIALATLAAALCAVAPAAAGVDAYAAFDRLKQLEGSWSGTPEGSGEEAEQEAAELHAVEHEFEVSANGTVLMETMQPGTDHEMINMYYMDGDDLVLTHYCSGGNQPRMRLNAEASSAQDLVFDFDGGTNLEDAAEHIHSANIRLHEDGAMDSVWTAVSGGEEIGQMAFRLRRAEVD